HSHDHRVPKAAKRGGGVRIVPFDREPCRGAEGSHRRRVRRDRSSAAEAATCGGGVALLQQALSSSAGPTGPADRPALHPWPRGHLGAGATSLAKRGKLASRRRSLLSMDEPPRRRPHRREAV